MTVRFHVSELLGKNKMTQKQLSDATGIRPATISALYHESIKRIDTSHIEKLCDALDCSLSELITIEKNT